MYCEIFYGKHLRCSKNESATLTITSRFIVLQLSLSFSLFSLYALGRHTHASFFLLFFIFHFTPHLRLLAKSVLRIYDLRKSPNLLTKIPNAHSSYISRPRHVYIFKNRQLKNKKKKKSMYNVRR